MLRRALLPCFCCRAREADSNLRAIGTEHLRDTFGGVRYDERTHEDPELPAYQPTSLPASQPASHPVRDYVGTGATLRPLIIKGPKRESFSQDQHAGSEPAGEAGPHLRDAGTLGTAWHDLRGCCCPHPAFWFLLHSTFSRLRSIDERPRSNYKFSVFYHLPRRRAGLETNQLHNKWTLATWHSFSATLEVPTPRSFFFIFFILFTMVLFWLR